MNPEIPFYIQFFMLLSVSSLVVLIGFTIYRQVRAVSSRARLWFYPVAFAWLTWLTLLLVLSWRGVFLNFDTLPPLLPIFVFLTLILGLGTTLNPLVFPLIRSIGLRRLTEFQVWRVLPETLILMLIGANLMPDLMTFTGRNLDIFAPLTAPIISWLVIRRRVLSRHFLLGWNILAILILGVTVFHGIFSAPFPFRIFYTDPPNVVVGAFPVTFLPLFMVPLAFTVHITSIRLILKEGLASAPREFASDPIS